MAAATSDRAPLRRLRFAWSWLSGSATLPATRVGVEYGIAIAFVGFRIGMLTLVGVSAVAGVERSSWAAGDVGLLAIAVLWSAFVCVWAIRHRHYLSARLACCDTAVGC